MEKLEFNIESINKLKANKFTSFKSTKRFIGLLPIINKEKINLKTSFIEIDDNYVEVFIDSSTCIPINITFSKENIYMIVAYYSTILDMINPNNIKEDYFSKWMYLSITNKYKLDEDNLVYDKYYNTHDSKEVLHKSISFFNFLHINKYEKKEYDSWV